MRSQLDSPFAFEEQALLYVPQGLPEPRAPGYVERLEEETLELCRLSRGRALVLTSSYHSLDRIGERLAEDLPYPVLKQGSAPRERLLDEFRREVDSVLVATQTFWQGVDVPGESLSLLVIDKLPFAPPNDPLVQARCERITADGGDWFAEYSVPTAVLQLRQGFGRLIRSRTDRGVVAILDSRLRSRLYGRRFLDSLPACPTGRRPASRGRLLLRRLGRGGLIPSGAVAKKKSYVPTPPRKVDAPRRVQAPRVRTEAPKPPSGPRDPRRTRMILIGGAAVVAAAVVAIVLALTLGGGQDASAALSAAGCTNQTFPMQGRQHVQSLPKGFRYNSFPPTSGMHYPQWAIWGDYDRPVPLIRSTHNLEHGGIVVQYGDKVPASTVNEINQWYAQDPTALLVAPLPALKGKVALTAWTHLAMCPSFNEAAFNAFRAQHIFQGPEKYPADRLQPGM